jgi:hypothetical protein
MRRRSVGLILFFVIRVVWDLSLLEDYDIQPSLSLTKIMKEYFVISY